MLFTHTRLCLHRYNSVLKFKQSEDDWAEVCPVRLTEATVATKK